MKFTTIICITIGFSLFSCSNQSTTADTTSAAADSAIMISTQVSQEGLTARQLVEDNVFIDVDIMKVTQQIGASLPSETLSDDIAKSKAALYRFYKNVDLIDGKYVCRVKSAAELNMSEQTFATLLDNMNKSNEEISKIREKGEEIYIVETDEEYLNSLLN